MDYQLIRPRIPQLTAVEQVLINRGIPKENITEFLNPTEECVPPLNLIDNLQDGAKMLIKHISQEDDILI